MQQEPLFPREKGHIGTDESGKGDYFGPLVAAGVFVPEGQEDVLRELGVRDSKRISDNRVRELAEQIRAGYPHSVVAIGPERYNALYAKIKNLNKLLAWAHARVIENILEEVNCARAVADQFGDELYIRNALMKKGKDIELIQRTKAEDDPAVAAASILAKVSRDREMIDMDRRYPGYGFANHKGYPTQAHLQALQQLGPCDIHRYSFAPVRRMLESTG